LVPANGQ